MLLGNLYTTKRLEKQCLSKRLKLRGEKTSEDGTAKIPVNQDYNDMAKNLAKKRVVQAGYWLAAVVKELIGG